MQAFAEFVLWDQGEQYEALPENDGHEGLQARRYIELRADRFYSSFFNSLFQRRKFLFNIGNLNFAREAAAIGKEERRGAGDAVGFGKGQIFI